MTRVVVVGGGVAGLSAALAASKRGAKTTLFEAAKSFGVSKASMPLILSDGWREEDLVLPDVGWVRDAGIDVRVREPVVAVSRSKARLSVESDRRGHGKERLSCDSVVICAGSSSQPPGLRGTSKANVFVLREPGDYLDLSVRVDDLETVVVTGPVTLSLRLGEILSRRGPKVLVYCGRGGLEQQFSTPIASEIRRSALAAGKPDRMLLVDGSVDSILGVDKVEAVVSEGGVRPCDAVVLVPRSVPSFPEVDCQRGPGGGLLVDASMATSLPGVFAAGDSAEIRFKGGSVAARLHSASRMGGEVAGINASGGRATAAPSWAVEQTYFGLEFCSAGLTEAEARALGLDAASESSESHSEGEGRKTLVSMAYDRSTHQVYGLQVAGWRASSLSSAASLIVSLGLSTEQLAHAEFPYSPGSGQEVSPIALTAGKIGGRERG